MPKMTLLEMVQDILNDMSGDEVNSINDTVESQQVAQIIKTTYYDIFADINVPEHKELLKLTSVSDLTRPNYLKIPTNATKVETIRYRDSVLDEYNTLIYVSPEAFLDLLLENNATSEDVATVTDSSGVVFYIKNNKTPEFYTLFNDEYIVCDSYDADADATLQSSKTLCWGYTEPTWTSSDSFVPDLDSQHFPMFLAEAKSACFIKIKEVADQKEEQRARKHRIGFQHKKWRSQKQADDYLKNGVNYARNR